jgi:hypothetical protein
MYFLVVNSLRKSIEFELPHQKGEKTETVTKQAF